MPRRRRAGGASPLRGADRRGATPSRHSVPRARALLPRRCARPAADDPAGRGRRLPRRRRRGPRAVPPCVRFPAVLLAGDRRHRARHRGAQSRYRPARRLRRGACARAPDGAVHSSLGRSPDAAQRNPGLIGATRKPGFRSRSIRATPDTSQPEPRGRAAWFRASRRRTCNARRSRSPRCAGRCP